MDRKTAAVIAGGAALGIAAGYGAPVLAASEGRDAPSPGPFNTYVHGATDGWHSFANGGYLDSAQSYTYTQASFGGVNFDEAWWKFDHHGSYSSVQIWDSSSGVMLDYATYSVTNRSNSCFNQGADSNVMVTVLPPGFVDGQVQISDDSCAPSGNPIGADAVVVNW